MDYTLTVYYVLIRVRIVHKKENYGTNFRMRLNSISSFILAKYIISQSNVSFLLLEEFSDYARRKKATLLRPKMDCLTPPTVLNRSLETRRQKNKINYQAII